MLDRALAKTFANLSTLLFVAGLFTLPLHVGHAFIYKEVIAVAELAPEIRAFPEGRQVRGVAASDLTGERRSLMVIAVIEALALPLAFGAARRIYAVDDDGGVPTAYDAIVHPLVRGAGPIPPGPAGVGLVLAAVMTGLVWKISATVSDMASADLAWAITGLGRSLAVALGIAVATGVAASLSRIDTAAARPVEELELY